MSSNYRPKELKWRLRFQLVNWGGSVPTLAWCLFDPEGTLVSYWAGRLGWLAAVQHTPWYINSVPLPVVRPRRVRPPRLG